VNITIPHAYALIVIVALAFLIAIHHGFRGVSASISV
jgi:hypothetical protein